MKIFHSEGFPIPLPPGHRFPFEKYQLVRMQLEHEGLIRPGMLVASRFIPESVLKETHCPHYVERVMAGTLSDKEIRRIGFPRCPELLTRSWASTSGTVEAALHALEAGAGMNLAGGTHHAFFDRGEGFCVFNDVAVAANFLIHRQLASRILVVDLDVHQGNGTAELFSGREEVGTFSMHCPDNYPYSKAASDWDVEVEVGTGDEAYLSLLGRVLPELLEKTNPDLVFFVAGVDVLSGDKLGKLGLTLNGCYLRDRMVVRACKSRNVPMVTVMGGGYHPDLAKLVRAHANSFKATIEEYEPFRIFQHE